MRTCAAGDVESILATLRSLAIERLDLADQLNTEAEYFDRNTEKMRYPKFREQGLFIGSRLRQSGMFRTVEGAERSIALRRCRLSGRFEDFWEGQVAA